jgi:phosphoglycerate dehydrogenase-like enzyme
MKVVVAAAFAKDEVIARLRSILGAGVTVAEDSAAIVRGLSDAEALFCADPFYSAEVAAAVRGGAPKLKWIQLLTAGYDRLKQFGTREGIVLCNAGDAYSPGVATHVLALLLALQRQVPAMLANQARHAWERGYVPQVTSPFGSVIAIVGFGSIGREVARLLRPFGPHIVAVSRSAAPHPLADEVVGPDKLMDVLRRADAIVLALPLDASTQALIGASELAACKRSAILINIARGGIVDSHALAQALNAGTIAGAGLDVTDPEPLPEDHPLWDARNLIISPHFAGASGAVGPRRLADLAGDNLQRFLNGEPLKHVVKL